MKKIIKFFLIVFSLLIIVFSLSIILAYKYEDEIIEHTVKKINQYLKVPVRTKKINVSVLKSFPYAAVEISNVFIKNPLNNKDTLFYTKKLYLSFNLIDLIKKQYIINGIKFNEAIIKIKENNYKIFNEYSKKANDNEFIKIDLKHLIATNTKIYFYTKDILINTVTNKLKLNGSFSDDKTNINLLANNKSFNITVLKQQYLNNIPVELDMNIQYDKKNDVFLLKSNKLIIQNNLPAYFYLKIDDKANNKYKLNIAIKNNPLKEILSFLNLKETKKILKQYEIEGNSNIILDISNYNENDEINLFSQFNNISIREKNKKIEKINGQIKTLYTGNKFFLFIDTLSGKYKNGYFSIKGNIKNILNPYYNLTIKLDNNIEDLMQITTIDSGIETLKGKIKLSAKITGTIKDINNIKKTDIAATKIEGNLNLKNFNLIIKNGDYSIENLFADLKIYKNDAKINKMNLIINNNKFNLSGYFRNILKYLLFKNEKLIFKGNIKCDTLNFNTFLNKQNNNIQKLSLPQRIYGICNYNILYLKYQNFSASNISGAVKISPNEIFFNQIKCKSMNSDINAKFKITHISNNYFLLQSSYTCKKLNIKDLFYSFNNFGQNFIVAENLKGFANIDGFFSSTIDNELKIDTKSIYSLNNITINKGELIKFSPIKALSKYIDMNELNDIKFQKLNNQIKIEDETVFIPKMDIKSSALNLTLSGSHTFDNEINYNVKVLMSDILFRKWKKRKKKKNDIPEYMLEKDDENRASLYFLITGTVDEPIVKYNKKAVKQKLKSQAKEEIKTIKTIFSKLKNNINTPKEKVDFDFDLEWDEWDSSANDSIKENK